MFVPEWQRAYPEATTWAAPGLRARRQVRRSGVRLDHDLSEMTPPGWDGIRLTIVPGGFGFREVAFFHQPSRTLVMTDLVLNLQPTQVPRMIRPLARLSGLVGSQGKPPVYLRGAIRLQRRAARQAVTRLLAMRPDRVVFAHGSWFRYDGTEALRHALRWLLPRGSSGLED
jgi:hypothetical protein